MVEEVQFGCPCPFQVRSLALVHDAVFRSLMLCCAVGGGRLSEDQLEKLIDLFEKAAYYKSNNVNCSDDYRLKEAVSDANTRLRIKSVRQVWI